MSHTKYYSYDEIKVDELGRACTNEGRKENSHNFGADRLDHTGIGCSVIIRHVLQTCNRREWTAFIRLRIDAHNWRAVLSTVINLWV